MTEPQTATQEAERVEIDTALIDAIVSKMVDDMNDKIAHISPNDDPSADYGEYWERGSYESEDIVELDKHNDEYEISYGYELSWQYREWEEYWTDPVCYPTFDEMRNETGSVFNIEIYTPSGDKVKQEICDAITKKVNDKIR